MGPPSRPSLHVTSLGGNPPPGRVSSGAVGPLRRWVSPLGNLGHRIRPPPVGAASPHRRFHPDFLLSSIGPKRSVHRDGWITATRKDFNVNLLGSEGNLLINATLRSRCVFIYVFYSHNPHVSPGLRAQFKLCKLYAPGQHTLLYNTFWSNFNSSHTNIQQIWF